MISWFSIISIIPTSSKGKESDESFHTVTRYGPRTSRQRKRLMSATPVKISLRIQRNIGAKQGRSICHDSSAFRREKNRTGCAAGRILIFIFDSLINPGTEFIKIQRPRFTRGVRMNFTRRDIPATVRDTYPDRADGGKKFLINDTAASDAPATRAWVFPAPPFSFFFPSLPPPTFPRRPFDTNNSDPLRRH